MSDIGWGIIGVPNGFQHISEGITANSAISAVDNRLCIEDYEKESLYAVIYDTAIVEGTNNRQLMVYFVQYNFSKETGKDRSGSFYGSYIALPGRVSVNLDCCKGIIDILNKLSDHNKSIYIENNKFVRDYTSIFEFPNLEKELEKVIKNTDKAKLPTKKIDNKKDIVVYANDPSEVFLNSVELYDIYSRIYTSNNEDYCRYIDEGGNANYKELADLEKESFDIVEARRIEQERIERYNREIEERKIIEQKKAKEKEQEEAELYEKEAKETFKNLEKTFFYCTENSELDELVDKYKAGIHDDFDLLKRISRSLEEHIKNSNNIAKFIENRKNDLDKEIVELEGATHPISNELVLAAEAASTESYTIPEPRIKPTKASDRSNKTKPQGTRGITSRNNRQHDDSQLDTNDSSIKSIIIGISLILIILIIIAGIYFFFFYKDSEPAKSNLAPSASQDMIINNVDTGVYQDSNESLDMDTEYRETDWESTIEGSSAASDSSGECKYDEKNIRYYTVTQLDIMDNGQLRLDSEIISKIMEGISRKESAGNLPSINKDEFEKMLMDCNDELNYKKYNSSDLLSNTLLTVVEGSKVKYFK